MKQISVYTDGACSGNPGRGGYGTVLIYGERSKELSGGFLRTTNNRMELLAAIEGLRVLTEPCEITLYSDSKYVVDAVNKGWALKWQKEDWEDRPNSDLWQQFLKLLDTHTVSLCWVKGHAGNPGNERADALAVAASQSDNPAIDEGYEVRASMDGGD